MSEARDFIDAFENPVTIRVNGEPVKAEDGQLLIQACSDAGIHIPHFCYHPRMSSVGMCRMCLVEVDTGRGANLQISCTLPVSDGMEVNTESPQVKKAQDGVLEFLLLNHPLDCPVCDKGGECPLQDQTMAYGPGESRFVEDKRHFQKPIPLSSQVYLDRERCILCDRCTRFADEVAGDALIRFQGRGGKTEVNTFPDSEFSSYFSGNTVQVCPVGALTAEPYRFKARPWDLNEVDSTYPNPMGDRVTIQASNNQLLRIQGLDVRDGTNWGWLTDKDRFSFQALTSPNRITSPLIRQTGILEPAPWHEALEAAAEIISSALTDGSPDALAIIGGASLPNEDQYLWAKLAKGVWGTDNVDAQVGDGLPAELILGLPRTTLDQALAPGSQILYLAPDPKEELGTLYLRLRHAILRDGVSLVELSPKDTSLTRLADHSLRIFPGEAVDFVENFLSSPPDKTPLYNKITAAAEAGKLTIFFGRTSLAESEKNLAIAIQELARAFPAAKFLPVHRNANIFGALEMGLAPGILPGRVSLEAGEEHFLSAWGKLPKEKGKTTREILESTKISALLLLGEDPLGGFPDIDLISKAFQSPSRPAVIALDKFMTPFIEDYADIVLPAKAFTERGGTHTNLEGKTFPLNQIVAAPGTTRCEWEVAVELARLFGRELGYESLEQISKEIQELKQPGQLTGLEHISEEAGIGRDQYSFRLIVQNSMYSGEPWTRESKSLQNLTPTDPPIKLHPEEISRIGASPGTNVEVRHMGEKLGGKSHFFAVEADASLPAGVACITATSQKPRLSHQPAQAAAHILVDSSLPINDLMIRP